MRPPGSLRSLECGLPAFALLALLASTVVPARLAAQVPEPTVYGELVEVRTGFVRFVLPNGEAPLRADQLEVTWKRKPQKVLQVVGGAEATLELGLLVDRSASLHAVFEPLREAALRLVDQGVADRDRLFVLGFADHSELLADGRGEAAIVLAALPREPQLGAEGHHVPTALYGAIGSALDRFRNADARAALLVVSDACDTSASLVRPETVVERARALAIPIFVLLPSRDGCRKTRCARDGSGEWICSGDRAVDVERDPAGGSWSPIGQRRLRLPPAPVAANATLERDRFLGLIATGDGDGFVAPAPGEWGPALRQVFDRLARQWLVVFEPSSEAVRSDEVRVYARSEGRRRRLR